MSLRERVVGDKETNVLKALWIIRRAVDSAIRLMGDNPERGRRKPDPSTGCRHEDSVELTTFAEASEGRRTFLCNDCGKDWEQQA